MRILFKAGPVLLPPRTAPRCPLVALKLLGASFYQLSLKVVWDSVLFHTK